MNKIKDLIIKYKSVLLYLIFGVLTTVVNIVTFYLCNLVLAQQYIIWGWPLSGWAIANAIAWVVAVLFAYITNRIFVFESKKTGVKAISTEIISFFAFRLLTLGFDMAIMYVMIDMLSINDIISKVVANIVVIILNYVFSKLFIFKAKSNERN